MTEQTWRSPRGAEFRAAVLESLGGPFDRDAADEVTAEELRTRGLDPNATAQSVRKWADATVARQKEKAAARKAKEERKSRQ